MNHEQNGSGWSRMKIFKTEGLGCTWKKIKSGRSGYNSENK